MTIRISLGVLAASVPREEVDDAVAVAGRKAKCSDGKLPPHVMVYFVMAMVLFADDDYEEVTARLTDTLRLGGRLVGADLGRGITQARQRLDSEPMRRLFGQVAVPVAEELTRGAWLGSWRLMAIDRFEWDAPDTTANAEEFGYAGSGDKRTAFPKVRVVTVSECASHAVVDAAIGGQRTGEQTLTRCLYQHLEEDWLLIAGELLAIGITGGPVALEGPVQQRAGALEPALDQRRDPRRCTARLCARAWPIRPAWSWHSRSRRVPATVSPLQEGEPAADPQRVRPGRRPGRAVVQGLAQPVVRGPEPRG